MSALKEISFLSEIEDLFESLQPQSISPYCEMLVKRIAKCLQSENTHVVEKTLSLWNNQYFTSIMMRNKQNCASLATGVYPTLLKLSNNSSNQSIQQTSQFISKLFSSYDGEFV